MGKISINNSWR